jgi:RHS repeat-associated protein
VISRPGRREAYRLVSQFLCFLLLFHTSGIAARGVVGPPQELVTRDELMKARVGPVEDPTPQSWWGGGLESARQTWETLAELTRNTSDRLGLAAQAAWQLARSAAETATTAPVRPTFLAKQEAAAGPGPEEISRPEREAGKEILASNQGAPAPRTRDRLSPAGPPPIPPGLSVSLEETHTTTTSGPEAVLAATTAGSFAFPPDIALLAGANLVSLPNQPPNTDPAAALASIAGQYSAAFAYNACDAADPWKIYDPADPGASDLAAIDHELGLWLDATTAATLTSDGSQPPITQIELCTGWNLIGYPLGQPRPLPAALASIAGKYTRVFGFALADPADPWEVYDTAVPAWANDLQAMEPGRGYWVLATEDTTVEFANEGVPPEVELIAPAALAEVASIIDVVGSVRSTLLDTWTLSYRPSGEEAAYIDLASANVPVESAPLGTFDPTLLLNGMYDLKLEAVDFQGQVAETTIPVAVDGQRKVGIFTLSFSDLRLPLSGIDIEITRTYDSRDKNPHDFGVGWTLDIVQGTYKNNIPPGQGWEVVDSPPPVIFPCVGGVELEHHMTTIRLSDVEVYRFRLEVYDTGPTASGCFGKARFAYVDGPVPGAQLQILGNDDVFYPAGSTYILDLFDQVLYEPQQVRLVTRDGREFDFHLDEGVTSARDTNGNELQITPTAITHSSGESITLVRDSEGRVTQITDPKGNSRLYQYDSAGDLVAFTDAAGNTTTFTYDDNHLLEDIFDPLGNRAIRSDYDEEGRLIATTDAAGNTITFDRDLDARREVVTNRLGFVRILEYDERGNVTREIDELGNETTRTFDANDNLLTETDPLGRTITNVYDANEDLIQTTDPLGNTTSFTYDTAGRVLTTTDPRGNVTTNAYDPEGNLTQITDALGNVTTFTHDSSGNHLTETDALGNVTGFTYNAKGNVLTETDALGNSAAYTYDSNGNQLSETRTRTTASGSESLVTSFNYDELDRLDSTTAADGSVTSQVYDSLGRVVQQIDPLGHLTSMTYDSQGRLVRTTYPDGTEETRTHEAENRLTSQTDRAGRVTGFSYDAAGRLLTTTYSDGAVMTNTYDAAGQLIATTNERGFTTTFGYDGAGRRTQVIDALGNATTTAYGAAGNRSSITDALGNTTTFSYDALNRLTEVTHPDATTTVAGYDALSRRVSKTDQAGITTQFAYDPLGRLIGVTDALGHETSYTYDEVGNRLTQTDANGHTTSFTYDASGRQNGRRFPDGSEEARTYNVDGTVATRTDFNGATTTYDYDANRRLTRRAYPDGLEVSFTYTPTGRRDSVTDARGTTAYTYDERDRLIALTYPDGRRLEYAYDLSGNRTGLTAVIGATSLTTSYTYDPLNRLSIVADSEGGVYTHTYDANGNRATLSFPNGVNTTTTYDQLNQLTDLTTRTSVGDILQSYAFTLAPTGHRTRIDEADGTSRHYTYDDLYRLTQDRVTDAANALVYQKEFTYDSVGNRIVQTHDDSQGGVTDTVYTYDTRDRLLTEGAGTTYGWDASGNLIRKTAPDGATYSWDFENRLTGVTVADGTQVTTTYDADGNRVRTEVNPLSGLPTVTDYLVDTNGFLGQVVVETGASGTILNYYTRGDQLLSLFRPTAVTTRYYHADGLGSIRSLTDDSGVITDDYAYTAFGELLDHMGSDSNPYRFAGEPFDLDIGFYYNRARWVDPRIARFVSIDPFAGTVAMPGTLHGYSYVRNQPVSSLDPTGRFEFSLPSLTTALRVGLVVATGIVFADLLRNPLFPGSHPQRPDLNRAEVNTHSVEIEQSKATRTQIFHYLASMQSVNFSSVATVAGQVRGRGSVLEFSLPGWRGAARPPFRVRVINYEPNEIFSVVTLKGHPLAGYRFWRVLEGENGNIVVQTGAVEHVANRLESSWPLKGDADDHAFLLWRQVMDDVLDFSDGRRVRGTEFDDLEGTWAPERKAEFLELILP